jgi:pimeloyl-ACP methyl ester carboxylesterase
MVLNISPLGARAERPRPVFLLVHGAWHGGWCWRRVAERLEAAGARVLTPTLTGCGERSHLMGPGIGLDTHIADIVAVIEAEEASGVHLCGHSYGGMVITGVCDRLKDRIASVLYRDAAVPMDGQSMITQSPGISPDAASAQDRAGPHPDNERRFGRLAARLCPLCRSGPAGGLLRCPSCTAERGPELDDDQPSHWSRRHDHSPRSGR